MDKNLFWSLIEDTKSSCGENMEDMTAILKNKLLTYPTEDIKKFDSIFHEYQYAADKEGLVCIANIMNHLMVTDDGFIDFRSWLIAQGKDVYMQTLKNPEILAEKAGKPIEGWYEFETIAYSASYAIENKTKTLCWEWFELSESEKSDIHSEIVYGDYADKKMDLAELKTSFPKFMKRFFKY